MEYVVTFIKYSLFAFASIMQIAMLGRALLSWFDPMEEWKITEFLTAVTEPFIRPIRMLCDRMGWFGGMMIDIPFLITVLLLSLLEVLVGGAL